MSNTAVAATPIKLSEPAYFEMREAMVNHRVCVLTTQRYALDRGMVVIIQNNNDPEQEFQACVTLRQGDPLLGHSTAKYILADCM
jgi:hypothetical protein